VAELLVSVIVVNYNGAHLLSDCLGSLLAQDYAPLEIWVVDNASSDDSRRVVQRYPTVRWIGRSANDGLGPGYNAGAKEARGEKLFFANNDTWFEPDCVRRLAEAFRSEEILCADPLQNDWVGSQVIHGAQRFRWGWRYLIRPIPFMDPYQELRVEQNTDTAWGCAGAFMFDREKFEALRGFDSTFFLDYEDLDLCWRGWLRGWRTLFVPSARLRHRVGESNRIPQVSGRRQISQFRNAQRFVLKVMPWPVAAASGLVWLFRILVDPLCGHPRAAWFRLRASVRNLADLPRILEERARALPRGSQGSWELLRYGSAEGAWERPR